MNILRQSPETTCEALAANLRNGGGVEWQKCALPSPWLPSAASFARLPRNACTGTVPLALVQRYVFTRAAREVALRSLVAAEAEADAEPATEAAAAKLGRGACVCERAMENFVAAGLAAAPPPLGDLDDEFKPYAAVMVARRMLFLLGGVRAQRVRLSTLAGSPLLDGWLAAAASGGGGGVSSTGGNGDHYAFTAAAMLHTYGAYLRADADTSGLLSRSEAATCMGGTLSPAFLDGVFATAKTYAGELDFRGFIDLATALDPTCRTAEAAQRYAFAALVAGVARVRSSSGGDGAGAASLSWDDVRALAAAMLDLHHQSAAGSAEAAVSPSAVANEAFDMVRPEEAPCAGAGGCCARRISLQDIQRAGSVGITALFMLCDAKEFAEYDGREAAVAAAAVAAASAQAGPAATFASAAEF